MHFTPEMIAVWKYHAWDAAQTHREMSPNAIIAELAARRRPISRQAIWRVLEALVDEGLLEVRRAYVRDRTHLWYRKALNSHMDQPPEAQAVVVKCTACGREIACSARIGQRNGYAAKRLMTCSATCSEHPKVKRLRAAREGLIRAKRRAAGITPATPRQTAIASILGRKELERYGLTPGSL
jgi:Fe2+ or Zn2+ uptake regulation protein